jgi:hypothetical protein
VYIVIILILGWLGIVWSVVFRLLAAAGGWRRVAARYPASEELEGIRFRMQYCSFGWVDYNGCVTIVVSKEGIYLRLWPPFRIGHRALLVPWSVLQVLKVRDRGLSRGVQMGIEDPPIAKLTVSLKVIEAARTLQGELLPTPDLLQERNS